MRPAEARVRIQLSMRRCMFKVPAYDPFAIAIMSFGILAMVALAFAF